MGKKSIITAVYPSLCVSIARRGFCRIKWITLQQTTI